MARLNCIVIDCNDADRVSGFWAQTLDGYTLNKEEWGITMTSDSAPMIYFETVPEGKELKNRLHLNIAAADRQAEIDRLVSLGATEADTQEPGGGYIWTNMRDTEGNEFCISQAQ